MISKYLKNIHKVLILSFVVLIGCNSDDLSDAPATEVDFTTFVTIGNSLTAGYTDGALFQEGQENSLSEIIAGQMQLQGGAIGFNTPFVNNQFGSIVGLESAFPNKLIGLGTRAEGTGFTLDNIYNTQGPFHNFGIPGAKSFHMIAPGYGNPAGIGVSSNPYFVRFASSPTASLLGDAIASNPTFFMLWMGNNDVLGYSTSGGVETVSPITSVSLFTTAMATAFSLLTNTGAKGVVANIPNVTDVPFFTSITKNNIILNSSEAASLNGAYANYNGTLQFLASNGTISQAEADKRTIFFAEGANNPVILDEDLTDLTTINPALRGMRQLQEGELILLSAGGVLPSPTFGGTQTPLEDKYILTARELNEIAIATAQFNAILKNLASKYNLAFYDANKDLNTLKTTGITYGATTYNSLYPSAGGNAFSWDGIHPTKQGFAVIANGFINAINNKYGTDLELVDPNSF